MSTMVYEYGLLQPTSPMEPLVEQLRAAHNYYNKLVEIERARRVEIHAAQSSDVSVGRAVAALDHAKDHVEELVARKRLACGHCATVQAPSPEMMAQAREMRRVASERVKLAKAEAKERLVPLYRNIDEQAHDARLSARASCGCYWGTYLLVEQAADQAAKTATGDGPRFKPWTGEGTLGVQVQHGLSADLIHGDDTRLRVDPIDPSAWNASLPRGQRDRLRRTVLHMRIGSVGRDPIWADWPMIMHRQFPAGSSIKWAKVIRRRHCQWYRWVVQFSIDTPEPSTKRNGETVALNLGWRLFAVSQGQRNGLRVSTYVGSDGAIGDLRIPQSVLDLLEKANSIRSTRDTLTDELRVWLCDPDRKATLPDDVRAVVHLWKSPRKFVGLARREGLPAEVAERLDAWRRRDLHLWQYETGCRTGALNHRRELYRLFAVDLARRYSTLIVEDYDLRPIVTDPNRIQEPARQRVEGCTHMLRQILRSTGAREGCLVVDAGKASVQATQRCHLCGDETPWDSARSVMHTCANGHTWDQDENNARNLLAASGPLVSKTLEALASKNTKRPARFAKRHAKKTTGDGE